MKTEILFDAAQIEAANARLAQEIRARLGESDPVVVLVLLNGALWFAADLLRHLPDNYMLESIRVTSYNEDLKSSGELTWHSPIPKVLGKRVLILDDVLDTGLTLQNVCHLVREMGGLDVCTAVMVDKVSCRQVDYQADFVGLKAGNEYLIGYGLDAHGQFRNLPYIAKVME